MLLILKAQKMSIPFGSKLLKVLNDSTIHRAKDGYPISSPLLPKMYQQFTGFYQKKVDENEIVCVFTMAFHKMFLSTVSVHLLEW